MAKSRRVAHRQTAIAEQILEVGDDTVLDLLDRLLNKGVMLNGDVTLGVAGVNLIYLRLSALFAAVDRVLSSEAGERQRRVHHGGFRKRPR